MKKINWEFIFKNGTIAAILMILTFLLPDFHFAFDISVILTIVSLLFAILVGFFIGTATTNYLRLQTLISNANADLIQIFRLSKLIQVSSGEKIANVIDEYMIAMLDFPFLKWVPNTKKEFNEVTKAVEEVDPLNEKGLSLFSHLQNAKSDLDRTNQEISLAAEEVVSGRHWFILISLALIIATLLLSLRDGYWVFSFVNGVLLVAIYQILTLLKEVDSNVFLAEKLGYQNPQQVFQAIGKTCLGGRQEKLGMPEVDLLTGGLEILRPWRMRLGRKVLLGAPKIKVLERFLKNPSRTAPVYLVNREIISKSA